MSGPMTRQMKTAAREHAAAQVAGHVRIHVCALSYMPRLAKELGACHLVTIINDGMIPDTPASVRADCHLKLICSDICEPMAGRICPEPGHVAELIDFVRAWDHQGPLLIHCLAGISRSTAAAYIALCTLNETTCEYEIARLLRRASSTAVPNRLLVDYADRALGRDGRMLAAISAMAPATTDALEGRPFSMSSRLA